MLNRILTRWCIAGLLLVGCAQSSVMAAETAERVVHGQPAWVIQTKSMELALTKRGGHLAPVVFERNTPRPFNPYYVSPWQDEGPIVTEHPVLVPLRGDFFCLPFGLNRPYHGESHPVHGETAGSEWSLVSANKQSDRAELIVRLQTTVRPGIVTKRIALVEGHASVYCEHVIEGFTGPAPVGHHATLALPEKEQSFVVSTSPIRFGMTAPTMFSLPENREYQSLAVGARFSDLRQVPALWRDNAPADCSRFPTRKGFCDALTVVNDNTTQPAWVAAVNQSDGYLWFAIKDPQILPCTLFWMENGGRHAPPWNGRNRCLGLEDCCALVAEGITGSVADNPLSQAGVRTFLDFSDERPTAIRYIQGAIRVPEDFDEVATVEMAADQATFKAKSGVQAIARVRVDFLKDGRTR